MTTGTLSPRRVAVEALDTFCRAALARTGVGESQARTTAEVLVTTDTWGVFTHGTKLLPGYIRRLRGGGIRTVEPGIIAEGPAWALVDGGSALGQVTGVFAMRAAMAKARTAGIAYVGVRDSNHFGAAGFYATLAAREGLLGIAMANDTPSVTAPGSRGPITGTNPFAYAIPSAGRDPIFLDIAMSTAAGGKVYAARQLGKPIPSDWLIDHEGRPTSNPDLYPERAALAPMTGHKGYGLALLIETLSGIVTGAAITHQIASWMFGDPSVPTHHGACFLAIDVEAIAGGEELARRVRALEDEIHGAPTADGVDRVLLPGEREWSNRRRALADGIAMPADVVTALVPLAGELGLADDAEWLMSEA
jgi:ureidoglycolate dehydrogenase (NAD+)